MNHSPNNLLWSDKNPTKNVDLLLFYKNTTKPYKTTCSTLPCLSTFPTSCLNRLQVVSKGASISQTNTSWAKRSENSAEAAHLRHTNFADRSIWRMETHQLLVFWNPKSNHQQKNNEQPAKLCNDCDNFCLIFFLKKYKLLDVWLAMESAGPVHHIPSIPYWKMVSVFGRCNEQPCHPQKFDSSPVKKHFNRLKCSLL